MQNQPTARTVKRESPIFPALVVFTLPVILSLLPARYRLLPVGVPFVAGAVMAISMLGAGLAPESLFWRRVESVVAIVILPLAAAMQLAMLAMLLRAMVQTSAHVEGLALLTTSIAIWTSNILIFSLVYWQIDRGGPAGRRLGWKGWADLSFSRGDPSDGVPENWRPIFADYFALAFNTSAAFSPTDVLPLTPRAKMLMVAQSTISLITVIAVGARAINILGS